MRAFFTGKKANVGSVSSFQGPETGDNFPRNDIGIDNGLCDANYHATTGQRASSEQK